MKKMLTLCLFVVSLYIQGQTLNLLADAPQTKWIKTYSAEGMGYLDANGAVLLKPVYEELHQFGELKPEVALIVQEGKSGLIDINGNVIVEPSYDSITTADAFNANWFMISKDGLYGLIDLAGNIVVPVAYEELVPVPKETATGFAPEVIKFDVNKNVIRLK